MFVLGYSEFSRPDHLGGRRIWSSRWSRILFGSSCVYCFSCFELVKVRVVEIGARGYSCFGASGVHKSCAIRWNETSRLFTADDDAACLFKHPVTNSQLCERETRLSKTDTCSRHFVPKLTGHSTFTAQTLENGASELSHLGMLVSFLR